MAVLVVCLGLTLVGCGQDSVVKTLTPGVTTSVPKVLSAEEISNDLKGSSLAIDNIVVYTADTDVNHLLGKPGQYISKANFADTTLEQFDKANPKGGIVETFSNSKDLNARKDYIESIEQQMPALLETFVVNGNYLLRLNKDLTIDQVTAYKNAFMALK